MPDKVRIAACHTSPVFLNASQTTEKCIDLIHAASTGGANLVVFPETFIPAFPIWSSIQAPMHNHTFFQRMVEESISATGPEIGAIRSATRHCKIMVSLGFSEKVDYSSATLFNSNLIIDEGGEVLVHHRKLMPTFFEKLTWSPGDGYGLRVAETKYGKVGMLICGENTNALARYALMAQGEQIHLSTWPAVWPTRPLKEEGLSSSASVKPNGVEKDLATNDHQVKDTPSKFSTPQTNQKHQTAKSYDNVAANRTRAAAHCFEAKCFGVLCSAYLSPSCISTLADLTQNPDTTRSLLNASSRAATMFLDPTGALLPGYTIDPETNEKTTREFLQHEEGILYADMDLDECIEGKQYHDVVGGYQRLDVFDLKVDRRRRMPVDFTD